MGRKKMITKTKLGKWAGGLLAVFLVFLIAVILGINVANLEPGTPLILTAGICMMISGIATFVTGMVSLFKLKDRSFVVILAVIFGSLGILIVVMEVVEGIMWRLSH
jgi:hypothetical protein